MKTAQELKEQIKETELVNKGIVINFNNEAYCIANNKDDDCSGDLSYSHSQERFLIWFNGGLISDLRTFNATIKRLVKLSNKWNLEIIQ